MKAPAQRRASKGQKRSVLLVDDHPIVCRGLAQLINQEKDLRVCGSSAEAHEALEAIKALKPDLVITDLSLKNASGLELIRDIRVRFPRVAVLVMSMHDERFYAERALRVGARGYVMKEEVTDRIIKAIRCILGGGLYLSEAVTTTVVRKAIGGAPGATASPLEALSDRELEVFRLIGQGLGTRSIAEHLYLSVKTVETYREHIKEKLRLSGASELLQHAILWAQSENTLPRRGS